MASDDWPDWLPADWTMQINMIGQKKVKCYVDYEGHKCYSKPQVFDYLRKMGRSIPNENNGNGDGSTVDLSAGENVPDTKEIPESSPGGPLTKLTPRTSRRKSKPIGGSSYGDGPPPEPSSLQSVHGDSSWLPDGWTVEVKTRQGGSRSGMKFKCYMDPVSGQKFFSKPQVLNHLAKINGGASGENEGFAEPIIANPISSWRDNSTTELDTSQTIKASEVKNKSGKKTESARFSSDYDVISRTPVNGLPPGWIKEMRLRKSGAKSDPYYLDPLSEFVFFSKKDALRYLESGDVKNCVMKPLKRDMSKDSLDVDMPVTGGETDSPPDPSKETETSNKLPNDPVTELNTNESETELNTNGSGIENPKPIRSITGGDFSTPIAREVRSIPRGTFSSSNEEIYDWLPDGWTVEVHYKATGQKYKIYIENATGKKLYSKPQVLSYLGASSSYSRKRKENNSSGAPDLSQSSTPAGGSRPKRSIKKKGNSEQNAEYEEVITTYPADGLPPGWIKELRTKIYATHKRNDPYYTDPVTGYIFRSKLDALRFLDHGDVNLCAMRPKVKNKDGNEVYVYTNASQKPAGTTNGKQLFEGAENTVEKQENDEDFKTDDISPTKGTRVSNRIAKRKESPTTVAAAQSSKRHVKTEENVTVVEKQGSGVNLEKQPDDDDGRLSYDIPEDDNWTDQCIDFAVKTLTNEILFNGQPAGNAGPAFPGEGAAGNAGVDPTVVNETPTKVNL